MYYHAFVLALIIASLWFEVYLVLRIRRLRTDRDSWMQGHEDLEQTYEGILLDLLEEIEARDGRIEFQRKSLDSLNVRVLVMQRVLSDLNVAPSTIDTLVKLETSNLDDHQDHTP